MTFSNGSNALENVAAINLEEKIRFLKIALDCKRVIETHSAVIFLNDDRAYKLKKPVRLPYLDFRSLKARERICHEELRLNRQLAGSCYVGLITLMRGHDGTLVLGSKGKVIDWLIEMDRLPEEQMLDVILQKSSPMAVHEINGLSSKLISFYKARRREEHREGVYFSHLLNESQTNRRRLKEMRGHLKANLCNDLLEDGIKLLIYHGDEITARDTARLVVEGHGDLRPEHVCMLNSPVVFDRVEFAPNMRLIDLYDEVGYLGLECAMLGADWIGPLMLTAVKDAGFPCPSLGLQTAYGINRCLTRARLSIDHLRDPNPRTPGKWPRQAQAYLAKAEGLRDGLRSSPELD